MEKLAARLVNPLVRMRSEIITLCLKQIGREPFGGIAVKIAEGGSNGRSRNTAFYGCRRNFPPCGQKGFDGAAKIRIEQEIFQLWVGV